jgi:integrase/recombinase XerD
MVITIFVRHSPGCRYAGDEFHKSCNCRKHLRWSEGGKQFRKTAGTRSWAEAEEKKRRQEDQFAGRAPVLEPKSLAAAVASFLQSQEAKGVQAHGVTQYKRELARLETFTTAHGTFTVEACTTEVLSSYRATWPTLYKSSDTRRHVQKRLITFLRFCFNSGWLTRVPHLETIKNTQPETQPLTAAEYAKILDTATGKTRVVIQLMRWSGLAVRDATTLKRADISLDTDTKLYRIVSRRVKTGTHLYIPIPPGLAKELLAVANGNAVYVFWNPRGGSAGRQAAQMSTNITAVFDAAGVESAGHMVSHRLRATFAVDLLQKGVPLEHVSKLLGHTSVTTTEKSYARWVKGRQDLLDSVVSGSWEK